MELFAIVFCAAFLALVANRVFGQQAAKMAADGAPIAKAVILRVGHVAARLSVALACGLCVGAVGGIVHYSVVPVRTVYDVDVMPPIGQTAVKDKWGVYGTVPTDRLDQAISAGYQIVSLAQLAEQQEQKLRSKLQDRSMQVGAAIGAIAAISALFRPKRRTVKQS